MDYSWINENTTAEDVLDWILADSDSEDCRAESIRAIEIYGKFKHKQARHAAVDALLENHQLGVDEVQRQIINIPYPAPADKTEDNLWTAVNKIDEAMASLEKINDADESARVSSDLRWLRKIKSHLKEVILTPNPR